MGIVKKYDRIEFELISPLAVGSGENKATDKDIVRDSSGQPYIPGSTLAGIYRSLFNDDTANKYFGRVPTEKEMKQASEEGRNVFTDSRIIVYDAHIKTGDEKNPVVTKRDMVALDEYKTAVPGAKFDFEILEPGVKFVTYIEQNIELPKKLSENEESVEGLKSAEDKKIEDGLIKENQFVINEIADAWMKGKIVIGAKTGRGYGRTKGIARQSVMYDLTDPVQVERWLDFDMYADDWEPDKTDERGHETSISDLKVSGDKNNEKIQMLAEEKTCTITLGLRQQGGISIRQYSTETGEADYQQLTSQALPERADEGKEDVNMGVPVIPGTSWAGAFRAQMGKLDSEFKKEGRLAGEFFGKAKNNSKDKSVEGNKTRIGFSESRITKGRWVSYTRNAIDRFTGGTIDGALYSEKTYYNGETELTISCDFSKRGKDTVSGQDRKRFAKAMAAAILDLDGGYMAVGGLTAVGRGLFKVNRISVDGDTILDRNGDMEKDIGAVSVYQKLVKAVAGKEDE